ncbi:glycosyltransferase [Candidatus Pacearchaeota archaeon]|nr:glycosyltransferase [Candidatus Pacearchaeota archaeon]
MAKQDAVIPNATLCSIVRDEEHNSAGGIEKWLRATLPHVLGAVVVDTGSIDRTLKILKRLQREYAHLRIYDYKFNGFSQTRNFALSQVRTRRALVLDADELIEHESFDVLRRFVRANPVNGFNFEFKTFYADGSCYNDECGLNPRLFDVDGAEYVKDEEFGLDCYEGMKFPESYVSTAAPVRILHFKPAADVVSRRRKEWYYSGNFLTQQPLESARMLGWKENNPVRARFG